MSLAESNPRNRRMAARLICRLCGHRWESRSLACVRCHRTIEEIERGPIDLNAEARVSETYWRGVQDGRKIDRRRAYRLGYQRGLRRALVFVEERLPAHREVDR